MDDNLTILRTSWALQIRDKHPHPQQAGLSLIDVIIALAILSILVSLSAPSMFQHVKKAQAKAVESSVLRALALAKANAIQTSTLTTLCSMDALDRCSKTDIAKLAVFIDSNNDKILNADETLIHLDTLHEHNLTARISSNDKVFTFDHRGATKQTGSFIHCEPGFERFAIRVTVNLSGRFYKGRDNDKDGIIEDTSGNNIVCSR